MLQHLHGECFFFGHPDKTQPVSQMATDKDIAPEGLLFAEGALLIDRLDTQCTRPPHRIAGEIDGDSMDFKRPAVRPDKA